MVSSNVGKAGVQRFDALLLSHSARELLQSIQTNQMRYGKTRSDQLQDCGTDFGDVGLLLYQVCSFIENRDRQMQERIRTR